MEEMTRETSWLWVRCDCSAKCQGRESGRIRCPRTFMRSAVPADGRKNRTAKEEQCSHDDRTEPHGDATTECVGAYGTHSSKFRVRLLVDF